MNTNESPNLPRQEDKREGEEGRDLSRSILPNRSAFAEFLDPQPFSLLDPFLPSSQDGPPIPHASTHARSDVLQEDQFLPFLPISAVPRNAYFNQSEKTYAQDFMHWQNTKDSSFQKLFISQTGSCRRAQGQNIISPFLFPHRSLAGRRPIPDRPPPIHNRGTVYEEGER